MNSAGFNTLVHDQTENGVKTESEKRANNFAPYRSNNVKCKHEIYFG